MSKMDEVRKMAESILASDPTITVDEWGAGYLEGKRAVALTVVRLLESSAP